MTTVSASGLPVQATTQDHAGVHRLAIAMALVAGTVCGVVMANGGAAIALRLFAILMVAIIVRFASQHRPHAHIAVTQPPATRPPAAKRFAANPSAAKRPRVDRGNSTRSR